MKSIVILISGRGSNMDAILRAKLPLHIKAVVSNRPDATGLATATSAGIPIHALDHKSFATRAAFDDALAMSIDEFAPDYIVLAGFMRVLTEAFIARYPNRIVNIHPSLLPSFPGLHTHRQALQAGVKSMARRCTLSRHSSITGPSSFKPQCRCWRTTTKIRSRHECWRRNIAFIRKRSLG